MEKQFDKLELGPIEKALPASIGVCVKDSKRRVLFQNRKCIEVCGKMSGQVCEKSCMRNFQNILEAEAAGLGMSVEYGLSADDGIGNIRLIDAVVINDGRSLTTIFSPVRTKLQEAREAVKDCKLSPSQQRVFDLVIQGRSNQEIAKALFISIPTVRTHLTRIYEKIPAETLKLNLSGTTRYAFVKSRPKSRDI